MTTIINLSEQNSIDALTNHVAIDRNNNWNTDGEAAVKELAQLAQGYTFMHSEASDYYRKLGIFLSATKIILDTATSSTTITYFGSFFTDGSENNKIQVSPTIMGITALICIIGITLSAIEIFISPRDSQIMHRQASIQFSRIIRDITNQLLLKAPRRKEMSRFFEQITAEYSRVQTQNDIAIPDSIIIAYGEKIKELAAKGIKISFPDNVALKCGIIDLQYGQKHLENQLLPQSNDKNSSVELTSSKIDISDRKIEFKNSHSTADVDSITDDKNTTKEIVLGVFGESGVDDKNKNHRQIINRMYQSIRKPLPSMRQ